MIEKKIFYNEPKPTKVSNIKPVMQGGKLNYLGKQKTITAPVKWKSGPTHPITHLAYISDEEQKVLVKLNMYKSMNGKPNKGPFGIVSLNDGDGSGGDSGGASGGLGGSDASGNAGNATGDSAGVGGSGGTSGPGGGQGPGGESGTGGLGSFGDTFGSSTAQDQAANEAASIAAAQEAEVTEVDMTPPALQTLEEKAMAHLQAQMTPAALVGRAIGYAIAGPPGGFFGGLIGADIGRGVTGPSDDTQEQSSVQNGPAQTTTGDSGSIYAPLYNTSTGDNTADSMRIRLENLLKGPPVAKIPTGEMPQQPTTYGLPSINPYSNYTLLDLKNLRR